jgi:hypothetical protein
MRMTRAFKSLCVLAPVVLAVFAAGPLTSLRAEEQVTQPGNRDSHAVDTDELFARAVERTPKWKNPALGLISGDDAAVDARAKASAGSPPAGKPDAADNRKNAARDAGSKREAGGSAQDPRKAFGKPVLASRAPQGARARARLQGARFAARRRDLPWSRVLPPLTMPDRLPTGRI